MIFPLAALSIVVNGSVMRSYNAPYIERGRVMAPLEPFVTAVAASVEYTGGVLIVRRADRFAQVQVRSAAHPCAYQSTYVPIASVLRTLGARVTYDAAARRLLVDLPPAALATPTPFNPAVPRVAPSAVFTPSPAPTPRPVVTGKPVPRRTPIPADFKPSPGGI